MVRALPDGAAGWRCRMAQPDGVAGWRCRMAQPDGVAGWRSRMVSRMAMPDGTAGNGSKRYLDDCRRAECDPIRTDGTINRAQHLDTMPIQMLLPATHVKHGMPLEDIGFLICSSAAGSTPALGVDVRTVIAS